MMPQNGVSTKTTNSTDKSETGGSASGIVILFPRAARDVPPGALWAFTDHRPLDPRAAEIARLLRGGAAPADVCCRLLCDWRTVARVAEALAAEGGRL